MPIVLIEVRKNHSLEQERALIGAVHTALCDAFKILNNDINVRLVVHEPHRFPVPKTHPDLYTHPELFTLISIDCYSGRSLLAKRMLYRLIVENLEPIGIPKDHVKILVRETKQENLGIRGGFAGCDINVGYSIEI